MSGKQCYLTNLRTPEGNRTSLLAEEIAGQWRIVRVGPGTLRGTQRGTGVDGQGAVLSPAFVDLYGFPDAQRTAASLKAQMTLALQSGYGRIAEAAPDLSEQGRARRARYPRLLSHIPLREGDAGGADEGDAGALIDGGGALSDRALRDAMRRAAEQNRLLILPPFHPGFSGCLCEGRASGYFRVPGIPDIAQSLALSRILLLVKDTGCRVHIPCVSTSEGIDLVRRAKMQGLPVTLGVTPFHFALDENEVFLSGSAAKLLPPLSSASNRKAVLAALADGTVDCINSAHTPCSVFSKQRSMEKAPFGAASYETAFAVGVSCLVMEGVLSLSRLITLMTAAPAAILGQTAALSPDMPADFLLLDPSKEWAVGQENHDSLPSPFLGRVLRGRVIGHFCGGTWV